MTIIKLFVAIFVTALYIGEAHAQKRPKPTPTPVPGSQIESGASRRTAPDSATTANSSGQVNKNNGMGKVTDQKPGSMDSPGAGRITKLRITVVTGSDDLRSNSELRAFLITQNGKRFDSRPLNCQNGDLSRCEGISDGTRRTFEWNLLTDVVEAGQNPQLQAKSGATLFPADVRRFGLAFQTHINALQSADNWNLDKLEVEYVVDVGGKASPAGTFTMYKNSGNPLYRFKTKEEWDTGPLNLPN